MALVKNTAGQKIGAQMVAAADGSAFTGAVTVSVTIDAGAQGTGSVGSGACTHEGNGYHTYAPAQAETNGTLIAFTFTGTGAIPATVQCFTVGYDPTAVVVPANVTQLLGTAWLTPGTAGTPDVNVKLISDDATAANNAEAFFDGTGYAGGTIKLGVNAVAVSGDTATADNLETAFQTTLAEESAVPAANAPWWTKLNFMFLKARNKITQTATTQIVKADDGTTTVATSTVSDDGTTATRGEFS